jgi:deferrochelatase/peroxidase EfeB
VPLALSPYTEDRDFLSPAKINNFDYTEIDGRCPFAAHVRKTAPRNLTPFVTNEFLDSSVIVRSGIPYGPDVRSLNFLSAANTDYLFTCILDHAGGP